MHKKILIILFLVVWALPALAQTVDTAWVSSYNGTGNGQDSAVALRVDGSGNVYVTGKSIGSGTGFDYETIKYSPDGTQLWERRYSGSGSGSDFANALALDGSGNIYVTGQVYNGTNYDYVTIKYTSDGTQQWAAPYLGRSGTDIARDIAIDASGYACVTGFSTRAMPNIDIDYATVKYTPNGALVWEQRWNGAIGTGDDTASAIAVDNNNNVFVTGNTKMNPYVNIRYYATIKYDLNGNFVWQRLYGGTAGGTDFASDIAVDNSGNSYVTGRVVNSSTSWDFGTIKYASDGVGTPLWTRTYDGSVNGSDFGRAITVDSYQNAYVTGPSYNGTNMDYVTIKYAPDGTQQWVARYNGPANPYDEPFAIAVDGFGNVYVTGTSAGDLTTIKYDQNGNQVWVQRYNGPAKGLDGGSSIAVDGSGYVYVTGFRDGGDYCTIKYWQNNPPNAFSLISPTNGGFVPSGTVAFDWQDATDPDPWDSVKYDLYVSTSSTFHPDSTNVYSGLITSLYSTNLGIGTYYWKVKAHDKRVEIWSNQNWNFVAISTVPVGYWKFNEGSGTIAYDSSGYGNNGTLMNGPVWVDGLKLLGKALDFDGANDYVDCGSSPSLNITGDISITAWVRFDGTPSNLDVFVSKDEGGGWHYKWEFGYAQGYSSVYNALLFHINYYPGGPEIWLSSETWIPTIDRWYHVAVVANAGNYKFYVDGIDHGEDNTTNDLPSVNASLEIGRAEGAFYYNGAVDQVKLYNRTLSPEEVKAEFERGFIRGDANADGLIDVGDVVYLINYLFKGGSAPNPLAAGDANCDGVVDVGDVVYLINYLFKGGSPPSC